jgi:polysaccharide export outer membrane protein
MNMNNFHLFALLCALLLIGGCSSSTVVNAEDGKTLTAGARGLDYTAGAEDYRLGAADLLEIKVFQADELSREVRVDAHGSITLPLLGKIQVAGLTQSETEQKLANLMQQNLLQNPQVTVFIKEFTSQRVTVEGQVKKPGVYPIAGQATVLQAIAMAEGPSDLAATDKVVLFRRHGQQNKTYLVDLNAIRNGQAPDPYVRNDDRIVMHRSDSRYWMRETATLLSPLSVLNTLTK